MIAKEAIQALPFPSIKSQQIKKVKRNYKLIMYIRKRFCNFAA